MPASPTAIKAPVSVDAWSSAWLAKARVAAVAPLAALTVVATGLWTMGATDIDPRAIGDVGLVSELSISMVLALVGVSVAFVMALRMRPVVIPLVALQVAALIFMLYGLGTVIHEVPRFPSAWVHAGIAESISRTGDLHPLADARFDWPVFFVLLAFLTDVAGLQSGIELAAWIPVISNWLYVPALLMIFSASTSDRRLIWLAVWLFIMANWIGQDYLSPQGFNFLLYLFILGILLRWFSPPLASTGGWIGRARQRLFGPLRPDALPWQLAADSEVASAARQRMTLAGMVVVLYAAVVASHQLTPFALLASVTALVLMRRCTLRGLPILMFVMLATWLSFMSVTYLAGHLPQLLGQVGDADNVINANVTGRLVGNDDHLLIIYVRLGMTLTVWAVAGIGAWRRLRAGYWDFSLAILAVVPFGTLLLQSYGGEILLRVYLFSLPFMAFFVAAAFYPRPDAGTVRRSLAVACASVALAMLLVASRYGNERAEMLTADEVKAVDYVHSVAGPEDTLAVATPNSPLQYRNFELQQRLYVYEGFLNDSADQVAEVMRLGAQGDAVLFVSRAQIAGLELYLGVPPGQAERVLNAVRALPEFEVIYENRDAVVFAYHRQGTN